MNAIAMLERCGRHGGNAEGLRALPWDVQQEFRQSAEQHEARSAFLPISDLGRPDVLPLSCEDVGWD